MNHGNSGYEIVGLRGVWRVKHDGEAAGNYEGKPAAFEAAVAAAALTVRDGWGSDFSARFHIEP
jgi:hypothetical protein